MGLSNNRVMLKNDYDTWKKMFIEEKDRLDNIFNQDNFIIEHVGSTSVKGLLAKPIVDIAIGINSFNELDKYQDILSKSYTIKDNIKDKNEVLLIKENNDETLYLIHIMLTDSNRFKNMIKFRDILINNSSTKLEYQELKKKLASLFPNEREVYTKLKSTYIKDILEKDERGLYEK